MTRDSDTRRMAETGTGSGRSPGSAVPNGQSPTPQPVSEADLDALVEALRAKTVQLLESRHATAAYAIQDALSAITSLRNQLTASEARERELRWRLRERLADPSESRCIYCLAMTSSFEEHQCDPALTNTENHDG